MGADGTSYNVPLRQIRPTSNPITLNDPFLSQVGGQAVSRPVSVVHVLPDLNDGDVWKWSFDIQRELPFGTALTVGYVGNKGSYVQNSMTPYNDADPSSNTNVQARRPFPVFYDAATPNLGVQSLANIRYLDSSGNAFHHGLQAKLEKRFASGVAAGVSYVLSKSHGDGKAGGNEEGGFQRPRIDRGDGRGRYRFDQTHNFVAHWVWEMPGGRLPGFLKHVLGGWQSNGILRCGVDFLFPSPRQTISTPAPLRYVRTASRTDGSTNQPGSSGSTRRRSPE